MKTKQECSTCKFWEYEKSEINKTIEVHVSQCRRYPPSVQMVHELHLTAIMHVKFPVTPCTQWCGEYKPHKEYSLGVQ